jgi:hypothetical protein
VRVFSQQINRPQPAGPPNAYRTYEILRPRDTHFRKATCSEVSCPNRERGWKSMIDVSTPLGVKQANYIRLHSGRSFTVEQFGQLATFTFAPDQDCFSEHRVPLEREPDFVIVGGDWRQHTGAAQRVKAQDWIDDLGENQLAVNRRLERG